MTTDVAVIGSGSFGAWTAWHLRRRGLRVLLLDGYGAANSRASSGGESRIIRMCYGSREIYTRWSVRAMELWVDFIQRTDPSLFHRCGMLWMAAPEDAYVRDSIVALTRNRISFEQLQADEIRRRFPLFAVNDDTWAIWEPAAGALMARRSVQTLVRSLIADGVDYQQSHVIWKDGSAYTKNGENVSAGTYVFACGPWLPKVFPDLLGRRIQPSRQEVMFFGAPSGHDVSAATTPCWVDLASQYYGLPDLEGRGFKIAMDARGAAIDPDSLDRTVPEENIAKVRHDLSRIAPQLANAPLLETRVCQYENTASADYLLDRHPEFNNVWIAGGGSGHGFKHGPAVGEYMSKRMHGECAAEERFCMSSQPLFSADSIPSSF